MNPQTKKKLGIAGRKTLAVGKMAVGVSKIASAYTAYSALSTTIPFGEYVFRRALIQKKCNGALDNLQQGAQDWTKAGVLWEVSLPDAGELKTCLNALKSKIHS